MSGTPLSPSCTEPQEIVKLDGGCQHPLIQLQMNINRLYILYYYAQERVVPAPNLRPSCTETQGIPNSTTADITPHPILLSNIILKNE